MPWCKTKFSHTVLLAGAFHLPLKTTCSFLVPVVSIRFLCCGHSDLFNIWTISTIILKHLPSSSTLQTNRQKTAMGCRKLRNTCWICREESDEWDLWVSCHHLFCSRCSSQMLIRRMPCPLCRVASTTVLRGETCEKSGWIVHLEMGLPLVYQISSKQFRSV
jgi:hypothetical protein